MTQNRSVVRCKLVEASLRQAAAYIATKDERSVFDELLKTSVELTGSQYGFLHEVHRDEKAGFHTDILAMRRRSEDATSRDPFEQADGNRVGFANLQNWVRAVVVAGRPTIAHGIEHDARAGGFSEGHPASRSFLGLPIHFAGEVVGVLSLANGPGGRIADIAGLLAPLVDTCGSIIQAKRREKQESPFIRPNDNIRRIAARGKPFLDDRNEPVRMIGMAADITDRKTSEALVRESEERFRRMFDQAPIGAAIVSLDYRFVRVNQALCQITGYTEEQLLSLGFPDITHPDDLSANVEYARQLAAGKIDQCRFESRYVRSDGDVVWVSLSVRLLRDADNNPLYYLPMIEDISVRKKTDEEHRSLHEQLTHVARLSTLGEMVAGIAHDVNQPLYSIMNYAKACRNVLLQSDPRNDKLLQWNEQIAAEAARAGEIIKRMRDLARKAKARRLPTGVHDVVEESLALVGFETRRLHVSVCKEFSESVRLANFDRIQIQQVLVNLLRNACDALEARPQGERQITIRTTTDGAFVEVVISDNGPGLQEAEASRIFDAFVTSKPAGLGMGLAISKSIIETHGGRIWVTGNLGGGAEFHFTLPFTTGERTND